MEFLHGFLKWRCRITSHLLSHLGCKWEQALRMHGSWNTKTGYMTGVLQLAAAAQDSENRFAAVLNAA
jgi:hypothetical protein